MNLRKDQLYKMIFGAMLGAIGSFVMEVTNCQSMNETIKEEVHKQLEFEFEKEESEEEV